MQKVALLERDPRMCQWHAPTHGEGAGGEGEMSLIAYSQAAGSEFGRGEKGIGE